MIIPKEELANFQRWQVGSFDQKPVEVASTPTTTAPAEEAAPLPPPPVEVENTIKLPTAEEIESMHQAAHAEGYAAGYAEGRQAAEQAASEAATQEAARFSALIGNLQHALDHIDQSVADELLALALEVAAQVIRGAIAVKTDVLLPVIREAVNTLPLHHGHIVLRLNPEDADHVRSLLGEEFTQTGTQIVEDSSINVGGCRLEAGASEIDATIETRWKRVLEAIGTAPREWLNT